MVENKEFSEISAVRAEYLTVKNILVIVFILIILILLIYINIATARSKGTNLDSNEKSSVLKFYENPAPTLIKEKSALSEQQLVAKQQDDVKMDEISSDLDNINNIDHEKLMQFKKMMDEANLVKMNEINQRRKAATLIMNKSYADRVAGVEGEIKSDNKKILVNELSNNSNSVVNAIKTTSLASTILEGTIIHATLETAVNSDLPGVMRAVINRTVYSADGINKLLNPGDRLVMQYTSKLTQGARRIFAIGSRIIKADGISINLNSPVATPLGVSGLSSDVTDTHFFARFGEAALLAIISAGAATWNVGAQEELNSASLYREGLSSSFSSAANETLQTNASRAPTLYVNQGKEISVFVAKDINFSNV